MINQENTLVVIQDWLKRNGLTTKSKRNAMLETYRRAMSFHNGDLTTTRTLGLPSQIRTVNTFLITTSKEQPRVWGWYMLTDNGKLIIQDLIDKNIWNEYLNALIFSNQML